MLPWCSYDERLLSWWRGQAETAASLGRWELECNARSRALWPEFAVPVLTWQQLAITSFGRQWPQGTPTCQCHSDCYYRLFAAWVQVWERVCAAWVTVREESGVA